MEQDIKTKVFLYDKVNGFAKKSTSKEQQHVKIYSYLLDYLLTVYKNMLGCLNFMKARQT